MAHIISDCCKLAGTEYTKRHNNVASIVYRAIWAEYNLEYSNEWWIEPERIVRNKFAKILWYFPTQTSKQLPSDWPEIVLNNYKVQTVLTIEIAASRDENIQDRKLENFDKY